MIPALILQQVVDHDRELGAMGNMVYINNIIAVCTVLDVKNAEGAIIKKTVIPMAIYGVIAVAIAIIFFPLR